VKKDNEKYCTLHRLGNEFFFTDNYSL